MERSLDIDLLSGALAGRTGVLSADELQHLMADAEMHLFFEKANIGPELLQTAWYLHAVASVHNARERYTLARQRQAFLVSAHIFDLALAKDDLTDSERLSIAFACAIGYRRGGRDPNASAVFDRVRNSIHGNGEVSDNISTLALQAGVAFLGFNTKVLFRWFRNWKTGLRDMALAVGLDNLSGTMLGSVQQLVEGTSDILSYLTYGDAGLLQRGQQRLYEAARGEPNQGDPSPGHFSHARSGSDVNSRWVAAHLLSFAGEAEKGSLWNPRVMPPSVPDAVRHAFTLGSPAVLTLWEPQRDLLLADPSPFNPAVKRMVLSVPTSGGKTLIAQLLSVEQVARSGTGVCYVVPTRGLGREVRRALSKRLASIIHEMAPDLPDFAQDFLVGGSASTEVMTPERLLHLLRHDAAEVLARFSMFIFDEAQLLSEGRRGFVVESAIATIDHLTKDTDHRVVLISAAMGNVGTIAAWLDPSGAALQHVSEWRGPRRLTAVFSTKADWSTTRAETAGGNKWPYRIVTNLAGEIHLRMAYDDVRALTTGVQQGWEISRKATSPFLRASGLTRDPAKSTKNYVIASQVITSLGRAGSVLVVASTRRLVKQLAAAIADDLAPAAEMTPIVESVRVHLGDDHPLLGALASGVGFHHAGLPVEVLETLEGAVREEKLRYLVCTSTLTDGINLPARTVVIYDQFHEGQPDQARLRGARLVNAMGRAGRAGKETEGWIVLVRPAAYKPSDFEDLAPNANELLVNSSLVTSEAIESFNNLEKAARLDEDALYTSSQTAAADFLAFVWLILISDEERGIDPAQVNMQQVAATTLAWRQNPELHQILLATAERAREKYLHFPPQNRRRILQTGLSLGSASKLLRIASDISKNLIANESEWLKDKLLLPEYVLSKVVPLDELLSLPEAPEWLFKATERGAKLSVDPQLLLTDWIAGSSLSQLAEKYTAKSSPAAFRIEQMVDAVGHHFEHYISWVVSAFTELINLELSDHETGLVVCPNLGSFIRYGINDDIALSLVLHGIRSRSLAAEISATYRQGGSDLEVDSLREWVRTVGLQGWRSSWNVEPTDVIDLLDFVRDRGRSFLRKIAESQVVEVALLSLALDWSDLRPSAPVVPMLELKTPEDGSAIVALMADGLVVGRLSTKDQADLLPVVEAGMDVNLEIQRRGSDLSLEVSLHHTD